MAKLFIFFQKNVPFAFLQKLIFCHFQRIVAISVYFENAKIIFAKMWKRKFLFMKVVRFLAYLFSSKLYYSTHKEENTGRGAIF